MTEQGTYVYCLIGAPRKPALPRRVRGLPGTGPLRALPAAKGQWLIVADVPLAEYGEATINQRLGDLDWVSRLAVAHEAVVERFIDTRALLPMKLFTIFRSDARALEDLAARRSAVDALVKRVAGHREWGLRVVLDRARATSGQSAERAPLRQPTGAGYLSRKKAQRDATVELAERSRAAVDGLYDRVVKHASLARRRLGSELPVEGGPLLLDAVLLVRRGHEAALSRAVHRETRQLASQGLRVALSGPWPPYSFMQE
jgi:hypothetical protein